VNNHVRKLQEKCLRGLATTTISDVTNGFLEI